MKKLAFILSILIVTTFDFQNSFAAGGSDAADCPTNLQNNVTCGSETVTVNCTANDPKKPGSGSGTYSGLNNMCAIMVYPMNCGNLAGSTGDCVGAGRATEPVPGE